MEAIAEDGKTIRADGGAADEPWSGNTKAERTDAPGEKVVVAMLITKHEIVRVLRNAGLPDVAEEAERSLPDEIDLERAAEFGARHSITRDDLISRMRGSP